MFALRALISVVKNATSVTCMFFYIFFAKVAKYLCDDDDDDDVLHLLANK